MMLRMAKVPMRIFLREWRQHRSMTQAAFADRMHMTNANVSRIESGKQNWDSSFLEHAAEVLNCTPADLIRRRPQDPHEIEIAGLAPDQVDLVRGMVEQLRRTGTGD